MKSISVVVGLLVGIGGSLAVREAAASWSLQDNTVNPCHLWLAWPYTSNCSDHVGGQGYRVQQAKPSSLGWTNDSLAAGRGMAMAMGNAAVVSTPYLFLITEDGKVRYRTGSFPGGAWTDMPLNICGTGSTIQFDHTGARPIIAVKWDKGSQVQVPWVIDAAGHARFWRTSSNPKCWALVDTIPGSGTVNGIGTFLDYDGASNGQTRIWATRGTSVYMFDGAHWGLIDTDTGSIGSGSPFATTPDGVHLWRYDLDDGWSFDQDLPIAARALQSSPEDLTSDRPAFLDGLNRVWRWDR